MIKNALVVLALIAGVVCHARALPLDECLLGNTSSAGVYDCSKQHAEISDLELNKAYIDLKARVNKGYKVDPSLGNELLNRIKSSQRAWLKARDKNCSVETFIITPGLAFESTKNICLARQSIERTRYLRNLSF